jgi:hypothetical protein
MYEWEADIDDPGGGMDPEVAKQLSSEMQLRLDKAKEEARLAQEMNAIIDDRVGKLKAESILQQKTIESIKQQYNKIKDMKITEGERLELYKKLAETSTKEISNLQQSAGLSEKFANRLKDAAANLDNIDPAKAEAARKEFELIIAAMEDTQKYADTAQTSINSLAASVGLLGQASESKTFGPMIKFIGQLAKDTDTMGAKIKMLGAGIAGMFGPLNLIINLLQIVVDMFIEIDEATAGAVAQTGLLKSEFHAVAMMAKEDALGKFGISAKDVTKQTIALKNAFGNLLPVTSAAGYELQKTAAMMEKIGFSGDQTVKSVKKMAQATGGLSEKNIAKANQRFKTMSVTLMKAGMTSKQIGGDFEAMYGKLIGYGPDAEKQFQQLALQAKNAGVSMGEMLGIAKDFQKFKSGADKVAQLNSVLGTSLSSIDLMGKTAPERMDAIRDSLNMATGGFQQMDRYQQLAAAEMLGFGDDLSKLSGFMDGSLRKSQEDEINRKKEQQETQQYLTKAAKDSIPMIQQLIMEFKAFFQSLQPVLSGVKVLTPAIEFMAYIIRGLFSLMGEFPVLTGIMVGGYMAIRGAVALSNITTAIAIKLSGAETASQIALARAKRGRIIADKLQVFWTAATTKATYTAIIADKAQKIGMIATAVAAKIKAGAMFALGVATNFAVMKWVILAGVLAGVVYILRQKINPPFIVAFFFMAAGVAALGLAFNFMGPLAIVAALAMAVLVGAMALMFSQITAMVDSLVNLMTLIPGVVGMLPMFVLGIMGIAVAWAALSLTVLSGSALMAFGLFALGLAFVFLGNMALMAAIGIGVSLFSLLALAAVMGLMGASMKDMAAVGEGVMKMGQGLAAFAAGLSTLAGAAIAMLTGMGGKSIFVKHSGDGTTLVAGKAGGIMFMPPKITVDVKIPDMEGMSTNVDVKVFIDGEEFRGMIHKEIAKTR